VEFSQIARQRLAYPMRVLEERTNEVFQDGEGDLVGESINGSACDPRDDQVPGRFVHADLVRR
jgi:hypothetical protein